MGIGCGGYNHQPAFSPSNNAVIYTLLFFCPAFAIPGAASTVARRYESAWCAATCFKTCNGRSSRQFER
eukprot:1916685-Pleurochrysis_carterae.AAC.1